MTSHEPHPGSYIASPRGECAASRHGTRVAYSEGCRCDTAVHAHFRYEKTLRAEHRADHHRRVDVTGTRRRLQALCAIGYSQPELADHLDVTQQCIWQYLTGPRPTVLRTTAARVARLYARLADTPSTNPRAPWPLGNARRHGWLPPLWWDDDTIDDPAYDPRYVRSEEEFFHTIDPVVVERLIAGEPVTATRHERVEAVRILDSRDYSHTQIAGRLRMSGKRVADLLGPSSVRPPKHPASMSSDDWQEATG